MVGAAVSIVPLVAVTPASATEQPAITIGPNEIIEVDYDALVVSNPAGEADDPETCRTAPYCYAIPLHLERPAELDSDAEFTLRFRMSWEVEVEDVEAPALGEVTSNDMDLNIWKYPYTPNDERGEPTEAMNVGGATGAQPEKTSMNTPPDDTYWLVITNFYGVNRGVKLTVSWEPEEFPAPFEDLGDGARPKDLSAEEAPITPSFTAAPDAGFSDLAPINPASIDPSVGPDAGAFGTPTLSPIAVDPNDFIDAAGDRDLESDLLEEARQLTARPAAAFSPPEPVGGAIVAFWLVAVPIALVLAAAIYLIRRRPVALSV
jgi:hypothetical protein